MKWLLDTDTVIYYMNQLPAVVGRVEETRVADRYLSLITVGELFFGIFRSKQVERNLSRYRRFCAGMKLLPFTPALAERFGAVKADLASRGEIVADHDLWIAAHALGTVQLWLPITRATSVGSRGCDSRTGRSELWRLRGDSRSDSMLLVAIPSKQPRQKWYPGSRRFDPLPPEKSATVQIL